MKTNEILHILRNPYGRRHIEIRQAALAAADEIERWKVAFENMRDWAKQNGLDVMTYNNPPEPTDIQRKRELKS